MHLCNPYCFSTAKLLHELASILLYTYITCVVNVVNKLDLRLLNSRVQNPLIFFSRWMVFYRKHFISSFLGLLFIVRVPGYHHLPLNFAATTLELSNGGLLLIQHVSGRHNFLLRGTVKPVMYIGTSVAVLQLQLSPEALTSFTSSWAADIRVGRAKCRETQSGVEGEKQQSVSF